MARPSDREYELQRQIKQLKEINVKLETEITRLKKQVEKQTPKEDNPKARKTTVLRACPDCGEEIKITDLPHAVMELCSAACGFRKVRNK